MNAGCLLIVPMPIKKQPILVRDLINREDLQLTPWTGESGLSKEISNDKVNRPGLALAGFTERFTNNRLQILGETEWTYLLSLPPETRRRTVERILAFDVPCIVITKGMAPSAELKEAGERFDTAILGSTLTTDEFSHFLIEYLEPYFAPSTAVHGALVDVYGIGLLFTGRSGIGKSETALDLVERGHRLVADDVVTAYRMRRGVVMGTGNELMQHYMEIRGVGLIDIPSMFGIRSTRVRKRIEVVVELEEWQDKANYERTGLEEKTTTLLDVELPFVRIPIVSGKNLTVIAEVVALNHSLKLVGMNPAVELNQRLVDIMKQKKAVKYDQEDYE